MKKFMVEAFKAFWIPVIMAVVSYIFFTLKDIMLGIIVLVALSAAYTLIRLYVSYKKWWLLIILMVVLVASGGTYFYKAPTISLTVNGEKITAAQTDIGGGTLLVSPAPKNGLYAKGTVVTLTATAGSGHDWKSWVGTDNDATNPTTIKMNNAMQIRVNFDSRFSLIINNQMVIGSFLSFPEGDISISPAPESDGKYTSGTVVTLSVRSNTGYDWRSWSGTANDLINPTTVIMSGGNKNVNVDFEGRFALIINNRLVIGPTVNVEDGSVTPVSGTFDTGAVITLTATPADGYIFDSWEGNVTGTVSTIELTMNKNKAITAKFVPAP